jgi:type IX secretion system PorP/SprF family membrane protein
MKKIIILIITTVITGSIAAQDPVFSQPFLTPVHSNPGFTGLMENDLRITGIYRRHWVKIPSEMKYMAASVDKYLGNRFAMGALLTRSSEGFLTRTGAYLTGAYHIYGDGYEIGGGIQGGFLWRNVDYNNLIFPDQINNEGFIPNSITTADAPVNIRRKVFDAAAGVVARFGNNMIGFSAHHLNRPDETLINTDESKIPTRWTLMASRSFFPVNWNDTYFTVNGVIYKQQNNFSYTIGADFNYRQINFGISYRNNLNFRPTDALVLTVTLSLFNDEESIYKPQMGIAYDATTSRLGWDRTSGSWEGGFSLDMNNNDNHAMPNRSIEHENRSSFGCPKYPKYNGQNPARLKL